MMLIAIGLTTAVVVGVPVVLFAMDTIGRTLGTEAADAFAKVVYNQTALVDEGHINQSAVEVDVPADVVVSAHASELTISFMQEETVVASWSETYIHDIELVSPHGPGVYHLTIEIVEDVLEIAFIAVT